MTGYRLVGPAAVAGSRSDRVSVGEAPDEGELAVQQLKRPRDVALGDPVPGQGASEVPAYLVGTAGGAADEVEPAPAG